MANIKTREKRRAQRQKKQLTKTAQLQDLELLEDEIPEDEIEDEGDDSEDEVEEVKKEIGEPFYGPTSFEELDAMKVANEKAEAVHEITYDVRNMVSNILYSPNLKPSEKGSAIAKLGSGFSKRVEKIMKEEVMEKELDIHILEIDALIARDGRNMRITEKAVEWVSKHALPKPDLTKLEDTDFALVLVKEDGSSERLFPIKTKSQVRRSLADASLLAKTNQTYSEKVIEIFPVLKKAAKEFGIGLQESKNSVIVEKDLSGNWRGVLVPTNNFIDLDGEILSDHAHREYVEWVNKNMDCAPLFITFHLEGTERENPVDFVGYENGFVVMSVPLTESEASRILKTQLTTDIGMSHGSLALERNPNDKRIIEKYRTFEVSDLPLERAANPFTTLQVVTKEVNMDTKAYLESMLGKERAGRFVEKIGLKQKQLQNAGVESKEVKEEPPLSVSQKPNESVDLEAIIQKVAVEFDMEGLSLQFKEMKEKADKVEILEEIVKEIVKTVDEKVDEKLLQQIESPVSKVFSWSDKRASQKTETVLDDTKPEDVKLKSVEPKLGWLSEATNTQPVQV